MSVQSATRSLPANVQGAFFHDWAVQEDGKRTAQAPTAGAHDGLKDLRADISRGPREARELALDILVNLAAGKGDDARQAQESLRLVYADPKCDDKAQDESVRRYIENSAHELCTRALKHAATDSVVVESKSDGWNPELFNDPDQLSVTVAYIAGRAQEPPAGPNGGAMRSHIEHFLRDRLPDGPSNPAAPSASDRFLGVSRTIEQSELQAACAQLTALHVDPMPLELYISGDKDTLNAALFTQKLDSAITALEAAGDRCISALWINVQSVSGQHWMPLILHKDNDGNMECHVMDSDGTKSKEKGVHVELQKLLDERFDADAIHIKASDMQEGDGAGQSCGALGYGLLASLDRLIQVQKGSADRDDLTPGKALLLHELEPGADMVDFDMEAFMEGHVGQWNALSSADQCAALVSTRARLLDAWAGEPVEPAGQPEQVYMNLYPTPQPAPAGARLPEGDAPEPVVVSPELLRDAQAPQDDDGVGFVLFAPPDARPPDEPQGPRPPARSMPDALAKALDGYRLTRTTNSEGRLVHASSLTDVANTCNQLQSVGNLQGAKILSKSPKTTRPLLRALVNFQRVVAPLANDSPLLANFQRDSKFSQLANRLIDAKPDALVQQMTTQLPQLMGDLVALAVKAGQPGAAGEAALAAFKGKLLEVPHVVRGFTNRVDASIEQLQALIGTPQNSLWEQLKERGNTVTMGNRPAHGDAAKLLLVLRELKAAMDSSDGPVASFVKFAQDASAHPQEMAEAMRARLDPSTATQPPSTTSRNPAS